MAGAILLRASVDKCSKHHSDSSKHEKSVSETYEYGGATMDTTRLGCYKDPTRLTMTVRSGIISGDSAVEDCQYTCYMSGQAYAGLEVEKYCWCGNDVSDEGIYAGYFETCGLNRLDLYKAIYPVGSTVIVMPTPVSTSVAGSLPVSSPALSSSIHDKTASASDSAPTSTTATFGTPSDSNSLIYAKTGKASRLFPSMYPLLFT